jgi:FixJ family two-component response regulator
MSKKQAVVAIVDDDPRLLESLGNLLEAAGHAVHAFASARTLLAEEHLSNVDCLITDIDIPVIDGFELARMAHAQWPNLPVILITGRHEFSSQRRVRELKPGRYFEKPFDGKKLLSAIADAIRA